MKCSCVLASFFISFILCVSHGHSQRTDPIPHPDKAIALTGSSGTVHETISPPVRPAVPAERLEHGRIVISEFRPAGPGDSAISSASDEFIELFNPAPDTILLDNQVLVQRGNGSNKDAVVFVFSGENARTIPGYGHLLIGKNMSGRKNPGAVQNILVDGISTLTTGLASSGGGVALRNGRTGVTGSGECIDAVAYKSNSGSGPLNFAEGLPVDLGSKTSSVTLERKPGYPLWNGFDTHTNAADFIIKGVTSQDAQPQNSASSLTLPPKAAGSGYIDIRPAVVPCGYSVPIELTVRGDGVNLLTTVMVIIPTNWRWSGRTDDASLSGDGCSGARFEIIGSAPYQIKISGAHITAQVCGVLTLTHLSAPERARIDTFITKTAGAGETPEAVSPQPFIRVDEFDGSGNVGITPAAVQAGIQTELCFTIRADEFQLSTVQFEIPSDWKWSGQITDIVLSDSGFIGAGITLTQKENSIVITIDSTSIINKQMGCMTVMNVLAPSSGGEWKFTVRTKAVLGKNLQTVDDVPRVTVIPRILYSITPRYMVCDGTTGTPGTGTPSVVSAEIIGLRPSTTYAYKLRSTDAHIMTWSWTDSTWGSDSKNYSKVSCFTTSKTGSGELTTCMKCPVQTDPGVHTLMVRLRAFGDSVSTDLSFPIRITLLESDSAGWLQGHLFSNAQCETPLCSTIVIVCNRDGIVLATVMTEDNHVKEGNIPSAGFFRCAVPKADIASIRAVALTGSHPAGFIHTAPPWDVIPGRTIDIDRTVCRMITCRDTAANAQPIHFGTTGFDMKLRRISHNAYLNVVRLDTVPHQSDGCRYQGPENQFSIFTHFPVFWQIMSSDSMNECRADLVFSYLPQINQHPTRVAWRWSGDTTQWTLIPGELTRRDSASSTITALGQIPYGEWSLVEEWGESILPSCFQLLFPSNNSTVDSSLMLFCWQPSTSKGKSDSVIYILLLHNESDTIRIEGIRDTTYSFIPSRLKPKVDYRWEVLAENSNGTTQCAATFTFHLQSPLKVSWTDGIPDEFFLSQNCPIAYGLPVNAHVRIRLIDILGRTVLTLLDKVQNAGIHSVSFDGDKIASGIYWIQITAGKFMAIRKMIYLK